MQEALDRGTDHIRLGQLLDVSESGTFDWSPQELAAVLKHQLLASVETELSDFKPESNEEIAALALSNTRITSFLKLLCDPNPPLEFLWIAKEFAKSHRHRQDPVLPPEVASYLYYAVIAAALVRCRERVTELSDSSIMEGLAWCREQPWGETELDSLFLEALKWFPGAR